MSFLEDRRFEAALRIFIVQLEANVPQLVDGRLLRAIAKASVEAADELLKAIEVRP